MELWTDSQDKENLDPASLRLHGAGGNKGGSGLGGGANGAGGGSKGTSGSSDASASGSSTKKRKLAAAGSAAMDTDAGLAGLGGNGKAQGQKRK